jgi:hypothetical protein
LGVKVNVYFQTGERKIKSLLSSLGNHPKATRRMGNRSASTKLGDI